MNNFSLDDFFAAFRSLRANGSTLSNLRNYGCSSNQIQQQYSQQQYYDCRDEDVRFTPQQSNCRGFTCRHTEQSQIPQQTQPCQPQQTQPCQPQQTQPCQPQMPQSRGCRNRNIPQQFSTTNNVNVNLNYTEYNNSGIIDGPGNDIYARNYSINTYNTVNNFNRIEIQQPTVEPTVEPTPTVVPPDPEAPDETPTINLMPLRNLLTTIEAMNPDGILADNEINKAINDPRYSDIDGNPSTNSEKELAIYNKIKEFNKDKNLISNVIIGDYSGISEETLYELAELSDAIKELTGR